MKSSDAEQVSAVSLNHGGWAESADGRYGIYGALPGEDVTAIPLAKKRGMRFLRTVSVESASPDRVSPRCSVADVCGGCSFQHVARNAQLDLKAGYLEQALAPLVPASWLEPLTGSAFGYRSKARLGVKFVHKKNRVLVGFRETQKPYVTDTLDCPILVEPVDRLITPLAELVASLSCAGAIPQIELAADETTTTLTFRHLESLQAHDLHQLQEFGQIHGIEIFLQPGGLDTVHRIHPGPGESALSYELPDFGLTFGFSPQDFTQVNLEINRKMVNQALALLEPGPADRVLDAFCGIGNFSLAIATRAGQVTGAEQSSGSIDRARRNARLNGIENADFQVVDLHQKVFEINNLGQFNKVLLDPPRSGAESVVKGLATGDIERVVYVSCNPETLARDVKILAGAGFELRAAGIIDMFPHTTHVESVALLVRQEIS